MFIHKRTYKNHKTSKHRYHNSLFGDVLISKNIIMFLQQNNPRYRIDRPIVTRAHDASILETCIPKIEKYKKGCMYRGISLWNSLTVAERNIETYKLFKLSQYNWRSDVTRAGLQQI